MAKTAETGHRILWMGREDGSPFHLNYDDENMYRHTAIIGQSGSGKSSMVARLIEEIMLHTSGKVIILDLNADFVNLRDVDGEAWAKPKRAQSLLDKSGYDLDKKDFFEREWNKATKEFKNYGHLATVSNLLISFRELSEKGLQEVLSFSPFEYSECVWILNKLFQIGNKEEWTFKDWQKLSSQIVKWTRKYIPEEDETHFKSLPSYISVTLSVTAAQLLANAFNNISKFEIWNNERELSEFEQMLKTVESLPTLTCINLAFIKSKAARLVVTRYLLEKLWEKVRETRANLIFSNYPKAKDMRVPIFVVIDEAHNLAPQEPTDISEMGVLELLRRIAAEGRKEGLFLFLTTQRPQKIHGDIITECDNVCIMRVVSQGDADTIKKCFSFVEPTLLKKVSEFDKGDAIFSGPWANNRSAKVKVASRRTREGGANLGKERIYKR